jgi:hypothetical protein
MRSLVLAGILTGSISPCLGQELPPISQMLPRVTVEPSGVIESVDPASRENVRRLSGPFDVSNNSSYDLKDLQIRCLYLAPNGTIIGSHAVTAYETFRAGSRQATSALVLPPAPEQARSVHCVASGGVVVALGRPRLESCPDCRDLAQRVRTCDCDLSEALHAVRADQRNIVPVRRARGVGPRS